MKNLTVILKLLLIIICLIGTVIFICTQNAKAIADADEVHIFYNPDSQGTHFDMGVAFSLKKKIVIVKNVEYGPGKSYPRMLNEWSQI